MLGADEEFLHSFKILKKKNMGSMDMIAQHANDR